MFNLALVAVSVILGALLTLWVPWQDMALPGALAAAAVLGLRGASWAWVRRAPRLAVVLSVGGYGLVTVAMVLTTYATVLVAAALPGWLGPDQPLAVDAARVIMGAVAGLLGAAWLDDARSPSSTLWPEGAYRAALRRAYFGAGFLNFPRPPEMERLYRAVNDDRADEDIEGWGLAARWRRAEAIRALDPGR
jgi:hypothetical protein